MSDRALVMDQVKRIRDYLTELEITTLQIPPDKPKIKKLGADIEDEGRLLANLTASWADD